MARKSKKKPQNEIEYILKSPLYFVGWFNAVIAVVHIRLK